MSGKNIGAGVYARLQNLSRERKLDMVGVLRRYVQERLLYRLSVSDEASNFCVKGGLLLSFYNDGNLLRPTEDIDFNGFDPESDITTLQDALQNILAVEVPDDGVRFLVETMKVEKDRVGLIPGGKVSMQALVHTAKVDIKVDVGFGNPINPDVRRIVMPTILGNVAPQPEVLAYPLETVIAEKIHAMVQFGIDNTRVKDYFDIWMLAGMHTLDGALLVEAVTKTFEAQQREIPPAELDGLTADFADSAADSWKNFLRKIDAKSSVSLEEVVEILSEMIHPVTEAARLGEGFDSVWQPDGGWQEPEPLPAP
ncbi:nucleotidyl transferase AbiEii/AbiGii toxin family protein [Agrobacterium rubi]|nr:nucleotidyl transferase AbiEii/AbiGii toxin family protein [Agrobacterium rubi]NTF25209.1 nucleotidyl transferase AbiEii/AbiGii toxin family protein [Agrobacterium rubi]